MTDKIQQAEMAENIRDARRAMFMDAMEKRNAEREKQFLDALTMGEVSHAWWAFNAALDCVEIMIMPKAVAEQFSGEFVAADCRLAINVQGLGLRVK